MAVRLKSNYLYDMISNIELSENSTSPIQIDSNRVVKKEKNL